MPFQMITWHLRPFICAFDWTTKCSLSVSPANDYKSQLMVLTTSVLMGFPFIKKGIKLLPRGSGEKFINI